jgi:hypothetical protein
MLPLSLGKPRIRAALMLALAPETNGRLNTGLMAVHSLSTILINTLTNMLVVLLSKGTLRTSNTTLLLMA